MANLEPNEGITVDRAAPALSEANAMSRAHVIRTISARAEEVWKTIQEFNRVQKFLPLVASCTVDGYGVGARRVCTLQDGTKIFERLVTLNEKKRVIRYSIVQSHLPFESYLGTIEVRDLGHCKCEIEWSSTFDVVGVSEARVVAMVEDMYSQSIGRLEKLHRIHASSDL